MAITPPEESKQNRYQQQEPHIGKLDGHRAALSEISTLVLVDFWVLKIPGKLLGCKYMITSGEVCLMRDGIEVSDAVRKHSFSGQRIPLLVPHME